MTPTPQPRRAAKLPAGMVAIVLLAVLLAFYLYQVGWIQQALAGMQTPIVDSKGIVQVFFTTPTLVYPDQQWQRPASPLLQAVLADIDAARVTVDVATFDFDIDPLTSALLRAKQRGAAVRLIVDSENLLTPEVAEQTGRLQHTGIDVRFDRRYAREFQQLFDGRFGTAKSSATPYPHVRVGQANVEVYFSPEDGVAKYVLQRLAAAKRSITSMTFSYTEDKISDAMIAKVKADLEVRGVFESQNARGTGADFNRLKQGGVDVLEDGNCYILHHKVIIIDERTVITGSYNFTSSAERDNDENLVIVDDPALARAYLEEFERVYAQAQAPARCR